MKLTTVIVTVLIGLLVSSTTIANDGITNENVQVTAKEDLKFVLRASELEVKSMIQIVDDKEEVLYEELLPSISTYSKIFDLSNLGDGQYKFVIKSGDKEVVKAFEIMTQRVISKLN